MQKRLTLISLAAMLALAPAAQAKVKGGMLGLGIGGAVGFVGFGVSALVNAGASAVEREEASWERSDTPGTFYTYQSGGKYYTSSGKSHLDAADGHDRWVWISVGGAVVCAAVSIVGFVNMSDGQPRERRRRAHEDENGMAPLIDVSDGKAMAMIPDLNLDPASGKFEARLLRVEF